ncbi:PAS domain-containing sensor histidine kinase [Microcoleus sp. A2-C5]|uniref:sensor histidine kinase n=1 Tax=Microcoleaceae TaxID=1892252 RepID=UPI0022377804|nr:PAS domain-containing sensor histidine kinase [Lyngbya sp. CCAP 1446/10]MCW6052874.1 PAS domain-containing sensor histidine kinase [Lyngbya sp. CCAP 1446/10]
MTHYHANNYFRSDFSDAEIRYKASEITSPQQPVGDRETQNDRLWSAIPHIVWKVNASGWATYLGQRWEEYTGVPVAAALGFGYLARVHPEDRPRLLARSRTDAGPPQSYEIEVRLRARCGTYRWHLARGAPANPDSHDVLEWVGTYTDMDAIEQTQAGPEPDPEFLRSLARPEANLQAEKLCEARTVMDTEQELQAIERFTNQLSQRAGNLCELLQAIADATVEAIAGAEFCLVALPECDCSGLKLSAVGGRENFEKGKTPHVPDKLLLRAFATGESQLWRSESGSGVPAATCAAAIESGDTGRLGVLAIGNGKDSTAIDGSVQLLVVMGKQAAIAINSARVIEKLKKQEQLLELQNELLIRQQEELENQGRRIQQQKLQLLEAAKLKSQFLATMSHELLTPMNAIIGFSQLLLRQHKQLLSAQQTEMVGRILNNGKNLLVLIDDILDLSKIESGRTKLQIAKFDLAHLVMDAALEFENQAKDKNVAMSVSVCLQHQVIVNDKLRLRQVLVNLISNAVKFTHQGCISIEVRELKCDRLIITVRDTGIGISKTDLPHIFDKFRQADQTTTRKYPGTGLGLAISTYLVEMMNGTITAESQPKKGSTFAIEIPRTVNPKKLTS